MRYHGLTEELIQKSGQKARQFGHSYVGSAHLLAAMAELPGGTGQFLRSLGLDPGLTQTMAQLFYGMGTPDLTASATVSRQAGISSFRVLLWVLPHWQENPPSLM